MPLYVSKDMVIVEGLFVYYGEFAYLFKGRFT